MRLTSAVMRARADGLAYFHGHVGSLRGLGQRVEVAQHERRLREDRERIAALAEHLDDPLRQPVLALTPLVRVGVGPHRDRIARPPPWVELRLEAVNGVDLD